jgi:hypothetical protein
MATKREAGAVRRGRTVQVERPNWDPFQQLVGGELADRFVWMSEVELGDGTRLHVYKDDQTGRFLNLTDDRRAFRCADGGYRELDPRIALLALYIDVADPARLDQVEEAALRLALAKLDRAHGQD